MHKYYDKDSTHYTPDDTARFKKEVALELIRLREEAVRDSIKKPLRYYVFRYILSLPIRLVVCIFYLLVITLFTPILFPIIVLRGLTVPDSGFVEDCKQLGSQWKVTFAILYKGFYLK